MPPAERKLSVANVIAEAFWLPWSRRGAFLKGLFLPAIAIVAVQVGFSHAGGESMGSAAWMLMVVNVLLWILFAVACHRLVLLGLEIGEVPLVPGWGWRETRFLACILLITAVTWGAAMAAFLTIGLVLANVSMTIFQAGQPYMMGLIGVFFFARMGPVLPAAAIGAPIDFRDMWHRTRGNTWRLMVIVGVFPWIFAYASSLVEGSDPGFFREVVAIVLATLFLIVEISALSVSYRRLNENTGS